MAATRRGPQDRSAIIMDSSWAANLPAIQRMTARADSDRLTHAEWQAIPNDPETT